MFLFALISQGNFREILYCPSLRLSTWLSRVFDLSCFVTRNPPDGGKESDSEHLEKKPGGRIWRPSGHARPPLRHALRQHERHARRDRAGSGQEAGVPVPLLAHRESTGGESRGALIASTSG